MISSLDLTCDFHDIPRMHKKYIPIQEERPLKQVARSEIDIKAPMCWLDLQAWMSSSIPNGVQSSTGTPVKSSQSDSAVLRKKDPRIKGLPTQSRCKNLDIFSAKRFNEYGLKKYLLSACCNEELDSHLHIEVLILGKRINEKKAGNMYTDLIQLKTSLLVKCLQSYFHPFGDCGIYWTDNVAEFVPRQKGNMTLTRYKVIMRLSQQASPLLRHRDLAVLETLANIIGVHPEQIKIV